MGAVAARGGLKSITIEATVFRNDGRVEHLGVVSQWHKNPLINRLRNIAIKRREAKRNSNGTT